MQIPDIHLTKTDRVWNPHTQGPWVSKTDVVEFELCEHRCFLAHQQGKRYEEFRTTSALQSFLSGQTHELSMNSEIGIVETHDIEAARTTGGLYKVPIRFYNHALYPAAKNKVHEKCTNFLLLDKPTRTY